MRVQPSLKLSQRHAGAGPQLRREQYELLLPYYEEESGRYEALSKRAAAYLSILGAVSAFSLFKVDTVGKLIFTNVFLIALSVLTLLAVLGCVLMVSYAVRITEFKTPISPRKLVLDADKHRYTTEDTYSVMLAGLVDSIETNRLQNDKCASALQKSLWLGAGAIVLFIALNAALVFVAHQENTMTNAKTPGSNPPASSPASSSPAKTPMADLLGTTNSVPVRKSEAPPPKNPPAVKVK